MKIIDGFVLRNIGGESIVVGEGIAQIDFNKLISLNHSAAYLWNEVLGREFTEDTLSALLVDRYGISAEVAGRDAAAIARQWIEAGIVAE